MRLQRGYVLLLAGGAIVAAGLAASLYYVSEFLAEIERTGVHSIAPRDSFEVVQGIGGTQGAYFVAFPGYEENPVAATIRVTDPSGDTVVEREIDLPFYSEQFAAQSAGNYTLAVLNSSSDSAVQVSAIIGDPETIAELVGTSTIASSAVASFIVMAGIAVLVAGGALIVLDRRRTQKMKQYGDLSDLK
ncbi:MAG: hypothetical protein QXJ74_00775 [Nitrososphaera sp.]|uniref:hypothetical protein n=1 Tax=Nitrososphaera sp. TaxID=1971748 RepID=UPI0017F6C130|nr:hypothetical protein [Nitrososphaera sp.]NWG37487.1 hypothetical protein [Nitrososphaera sp.]